MVFLNFLLDLACNTFFNQETINDFIQVNRSYLYYFQRCLENVTTIYCSGLKHYLVWNMFIMLLFVSFDE